MAAPLLNKPDNAETNMNCFGKSILVILLSLIVAALAKDVGAQAVVKLPEAAPPPEPKQSHASNPATIMTAANSSHNLLSARGGGASRSIFSWLMRSDGLAIVYFLSGWECGRSSYQKKAPLSAIAGLSQCVRMSGDYPNDLDYGSSR